MTSLYKRPYNPNAYVPGSAPLGVARAIQAKGYGFTKKPKPKKPKTGASVAGVPSPTPDPYADVPTLATADPNASWAKARGMVSQMVDPLMAALAASQTNSTAQMTAAGQQHADALAAALSASAQPVKQAYDTGLQQTAATADAASNSLQAAGLGNTRNLAAQLATIGNTGDAAQGATDVYANADKAAYTKGLSDVSLMAAHGADANAYLAKQPGIARIESDRSLQAALAQLRDNISGESTDLRNSATDLASSKFSELFGADQQAKQAKFDRENAIYGAKREDAAAKTDNASKIQVENIKALQSEKDRLSKEYLTLTALKTTSSDKRAIANLNARIKQNQIAATANSKALDRQLKAQLTNEALGVKTDIANSSQTNQNARTQAQIDAANKRAAAKNKKTTDPLAAVNKPGSVERQRVNAAIKNAVINPDLVSIKPRLTRDPKNEDMAIYNAINAAIRAQHIDPYSTTGTELRRSFYLQIDGMPVKDESGKLIGYYKIPHTKQINIKTPRR